MHFFLARPLLREHSPVPLPVAGWSHLVTIWTEAEMKSLGASHRVAPRTTALTCRPDPRAIWNMKLLEQEEDGGVNHDHDYSGRHLQDRISRLTMRPAETLSAAWGSVAPLLLKA